MGELDADYTYGSGGALFDEFEGGSGFDENFDRQRDQNFSLALGVGIAGVISLVVHVAVRRWLKLRSLFVPAVERGWDLFLAVGIGLATFILLAMMLQGTFDRWLVEASGASPGDTIAQFFAFLLLWAVYAIRAYGHLLTPPEAGQPPSA